MRGQPRAPTVEFRRARRWNQRVLGWADFDRRHIVVYTHPLWSSVTIELTLLHELVHLSGRPGCRSHGPAFRRLLVEAARARLGIDLGPAGEVVERHRSVDAIERAFWWRMLLARAAMLGGVHSVP